MRRFYFVLIFFILIFAYEANGQRICPGTVPFEVADLRANPDSVWISSGVNQRAGACCGENNCIEIVLYLNSGAQGIKLDFDPNFPQAVPGGSLTVEINCTEFVFRTGSTINPICLSGTGPFNLVYCKPGNNLNRFIITSIRKPSVSPPTVVSDGCTGVISATGYEESTITWRSLPNNPIHDAYLSATSGEDTVTATYTPGAPPFVDYVVCGTPDGDCEGSIVCDTVRVSFVNTLSADIQPKNGTICFGSVGTTLTANGVGGLAPYTYLWNTGATTQSIVAATAGTYSVIIDDATSCPIAYDTVVVTAFPSTIQVGAGADRIECNNSNPFSVQLNGAVVAATGGIWSSTGTGTFSPNATTLNASYLPSAAEIAAGKILLTLTSTGNGTCPADTDQVYIRISNAPVVDAGNTITVCANNSLVNLNGSVSGLTTTGIWSTNGSGTFSPNATTLNATYTPSQADKNAGVVTLNLTSTNNGICVPSVDNVTVVINSAPFLNANVNQTVCANAPNVMLNALTGVAPIQILWTTTGTGSFVPNATTLNATYVPSANDITNGAVNLIVTSTNNGLCNPVSDTMSVTITPAPVVNAGTNLSRCINNIGTITLNGSVTGGATTGTWTTPNGTGSFSPNANTLNATYTPSLNDITNGTVTFVLTSTGNTGNKCLAVRDTTVLTFTPAPVVNAGADQTDCANNISFALSGSVTGSSTTGTWSSSGTGTFVPNNTTLNATYVPSNLDISNGQAIRIILTSTVNPMSGCIAVSDTLFLNFSPAPIVNAGSNFSVCANNANINLSGAVSAGASTGVWSTINGTGTFSPNANTLNAIYTPSATDISNGTVSFVLSSTGNTGGLCNAINDTITVTITPSPVVNAGANISRCRNNIGTISLTGSVTGGASTGTWTTSGSGVFGNQNSLTTTYIPSVADIASVTPIQIILTSTGNTGGTCLEVRDTLLLSFTAAPIISAGSNTSVCANNIPPAGIALNGSITGGASAGIWTSTGTGTFSPNATTLNATYTPSAADITAGFVSLKLKTTNQALSGCAADSSIITLTINPAPVVSAGSNQSTCANNANSISLNGTVSGGASAGVWSSSGTGTFVNANSLNTTYNLSAADKLLNNITFTLTSTGNSGGTCTAVQSNITLTITPAPIVNAGPNQTVCNPVVALNGSVTAGATAGSWSTPNGTGTFSNINSLTSTYTISAADRTNGSVLLILSSNNGPLSNCLVVRDTVQIFINPLPQVNAGPNQTVCANNASINLTGLISGGATTGTWTTNGTNAIASPNSLNTTYTPSLADIGNGTIRFILTSTGGLCTPVSDTMFVTITPAPIVNAGANISRCSNNLGTITLNGSVSSGASTGIWTSTGTGNFSPNNTTLNAVYIPSNADITSGNVQLILSSTGNTGGSCLIVRDTTQLFITPSPVATAGGNISVCANNLSPINLNGSITGGASAGVWSTSGNGVFGNPNNLTTTYTLGANDISNGTVILKLKTNSGPLSNCKEDSSTLTITILSSPIVNAGINRTICANSGAVNLNGTVTAGASTGTWTSTGTGTFLPNANTLNASYVPSIADSISGNIQLILSSTGNSSGLCNIVRDTLNLTILPSTVVNAGANQPVCKIQPTIQLNGQVSGGTTTGVWATNGNGIFIPNANTKNAQYQISPTDTLLPGLTFILSSTNNGICGGDVDTMQVIFSDSDDPSFTYTSGTYCFDDPLNKAPVIPILASGSSGTFSSTPAGLNLNTTTGSIRVDLSALGVYTVKFVTNGPCPDSSTVVINVTNSPNANFSYSGTACKGDANLSPIFPMGSSAGLFTATPSGLVFVNQNTGVIDVYNSAPGTYTVTNTIPASGTCPAAQASTSITIESWVQLSTTTNTKVVCANNPVVNVDVSFNGSSPVSSGTWKTNGDGNFANTTALITIYTPGNNDITTGSIALRFVSADPPSVCDADSLTIQVTITPAPVVDAGISDTICATNGFIPLNGIITGGASTGQWTTNGTGTFSPNNNSLNANYIYSLQDRTNGFVKLYLTSTGNSNNTCNAVIDSVTYHLILDPVIDAGPNQNVCFNEDTLNLNGSIIGTVTTGFWITNGTGIFIPNNTTKNAQYILSNADRNLSSLTFSLNSNVATSICAFVADTLIVNILPTSTADAGNNQIVCANNSTVAISGIVSGLSNTGLWKTNGDGTFGSIATNLTNTYTPGPNDIINGNVQLRLVATGNGSCPSDSDFVQINITPSPVVNAGANQIVCENNSTVSLSGTVTGGANKGRWTTNGTGVFLPNDSTLIATYIPSTSDITNNNIFIVLSSTGNTNGTCLTVRDTMLIDIRPRPIVNAGIDQQLCRNNIIPVNLTGNISGSITKAKWSTIGGDGTFTPNDSTLNATYTFGVNDIANGFATLVLRSADHGTNSCIAVSDTMQIIITPTPIVNAGINNTICANTPLALNGLVSAGATTGIWSTSNGTGMFLPNNTDLNAQYIHSSADLALGNIEIILTSTGNSSNTCIAVSDTLILNFTPVPIVDAGINQLVCADVSSVQLTGSVTVTTTNGIWSSIGTGIFIPSNTDLNAQYIPSILDTTNGTVRIYLTSVGGPATCSNTIDSMLITFSPAPIINAGNNESVCENNPNILLNGFISGSSNTGLWKSNGTGSFSPNNTSLTTTYIPSALDISNGSVLFTLLPSNIGTCNLDSDFVQYLITPAPLVDAGTNQDVCANEVSVNLNGQVTLGASTGRWTTNGTGVFSPNDTSLNAIYQLSANDKNSGSIKLYLTSTGNTSGKCIAVRDSLTINILPAVQITMADTLSVCANNSVVTLQPNITGVSAGILWTTNGSGNFIPNNTTLNATYVPSTIDTANGEVKLTLSISNLGLCLATVDSTILIITPSPIVNAGNNFSVCANNDTIDLTGQISSGANTGMWTSNGTGTFIPNANVLNSRYVPSNADRLLGQLQFVLNSTGNTNNTCSTVRDTILVSFTPAPIVDAGLDSTLCENSALYTLNGSISMGASTGIWSSSGTGTFSPTNTILNPTYIPSNTDILNGSVRIYLSSTDHGLQNCNIVIDSLILSFSDAPQIITEDTVYACITENSVPLTSQINLGASTGIWTSLGSGTFSPNSTDLSLNYLPSAQDKLSGQTIIVITSTGNTNGLCLAETDTITIIYTPLIFLNDNDTIEVCKNNPSVALNGVVTGGSNTGRWSSNGTGIFLPNDSTLNATYVFSNSDTLQANILLRLQSTNNGGCDTAESTLLIDFIESPVVFSGPDINICSNSGTANLTGVISGGASKGIWTTTGTGVFLPNDTTLNAVYVPSTADFTSGQVTLRLSTRDHNINSCLPEFDEMLVNLFISATVNAGPDRYVCYGEDSTLLFANANGANPFRYFWSTGDTTANVYVGPGIYYIRIQDINDCIPTFDTVVVYAVDTIIQAKAGNDSIICARDQSIQLNGNVLGFNQGHWEAQGVFSPDSSFLNAIYFPTTAERLQGFVDLILVPSDETGCTFINDTVRYFFTNLPQPVLTGPSVVCLENTLSTYQTPNVPGVSYTWNVTGGTIVGQNDTNFVDVLWGSSGGSITLTAINVTNCDTIITQNITNVAMQKPAINGTLSVCNASAFQQVYTVQNNVGNTYQWQITNGSIISGQNSNSATIRWNGSGSLILIESGILGCEVRDTIDFIYAPLQASVISPTNYAACAPLALEFSSTTGNPEPLEYKWIMNGDTLLGRTVEYQFDSSGVYEVKYVLSNGICTDTMYSNITVYEDPFANFRYVNAPFDSLSFPNDSLIFENLSELNADYLWDFGDGTTDTTTHPIHRYYGAGDYQIVLRVTDRTTGCISYYSRQFKYEVNSDLNSPNIFTPNGDGVNDYFRIYEKNLKNFKILIFNRWGEKIYTSTDPFFEWDGTHKGNKCTVGTYVFYIVAIGEDNTPFERTGHVYLVR